VQGLVESLTEAIVACREQLSVDFSADSTVLQLVSALQLAAKHLSCTCPLGVFFSVVYAPPDELVEDLASPVVV